ncbi:aldo/keto reductase [candidate division MSBL1 archaeon SCGC-AAA259E17]|uniref:Aldo/keto reductase n=1 Tax=candidate division MSBL1 archaeon SCGC-AAA259E17 TaxID=1698263 RepID=A0A133UDI3_9EURY|nr:aldo/keto reductase [candidate division MSBL1 archaeon SCGC-AAA259E17]
MQYREFSDDIDYEVSALGFGAMRLPTKDEESFSPNINEDLAIVMIRHAIDNGVNYVDTAWPYHEGASEKLVGKALKGGYRESVKLATKFSWPWMEDELGMEMESEEDYDEYLNKQLKRLQADHIDFYLLHGLSRSDWESYQEMEIFDWLERARDEGRIRHIGFSFHDDLDTFKDIVDGYDWDFCQIMYNYLDQEFQAGREGLQYADDQGLGVVIMEPLRGGRLATDLPSEVREVFKEAETEKDPVEWALLWLWNQPEVSVVLSGMSTLDQVKQNLKIADASEVGKLNENEVELVNRGREEYMDLLAVGCTGCNYCMPCPNGVNITRIFELYNQAEVYGEYEESKENYYELDEDERASGCIACGQCEKACPQNLSIINQLEEVTDYFDDKKPKAIRQ